MSTSADVGSFIGSKTSVAQASNVGFISEVSDYLVVHCLVGLVVKGSRLESGRFGVRFPWRRGKRGEGGTSPSSVRDCLNRLVLDSLLESTASLAQWLGDPPRERKIRSSILAGASASLASWLRRPPRERKIPGSNPARAEIFPGSSHTSDLNIGTPLANVPCRAPGVIGSVLGLVGPVSVYCDWVRWKVWSATSISVLQHVHMPEQIVHEMHSHVAGTLSNQQTNSWR